MGVNSLPKTVTWQRRDCDLNPVPSAHESSTLTTRLPNSVGERNVVYKRYCYCWHVTAIISVYVPRRDVYVHALCTDDSGGRDKVADAISATMQIRSASGVLICHKHQPTKSRKPCGHIIFCHDTIRRILFVVVSRYFCNYSSLTFMQKYTSMQSSWRQQNT